MNRNNVRALALVATVAFAACGEATDLVMGELNQAEAEDLAGAVMIATFSSTGDVPQASSPAGPEAVPFEFATDFEADVECPLGGMVAVSASLDVSGDTESEAGVISYEMTQTHDGCMAESEEGRTFTLYGDPDMTLDFMVENNGQGVIEWGGSVNGGLEWVSEGRTGTCDVAMEFSGRQAGEESVSGELEGTICGYTFSRSFSIG